MEGFDIQLIGKHLAYIVRGETKFKNWKKNETYAGMSVTFLGENVVTGFKVEDQITLGRQKLYIHKEYSSFSIYHASASISYDDAPRPFLDMNTGASSHLAGNTGKQVKLSFYSSESSVASVFDIIHSDTWTSLVPSERGIKYNAIFLDHFLHFVWVYPLHTKSDLFDNFVHFHAYVNKQFNVDIYNYEVTCEDKAKRRNSGTKTKTFEENCYLLPYAVSSKEDTAYQRQLITRIRVMINSRSGVSLFTYTPYAQLVISQRYEVNVKMDDPNITMEEYIRLEKEKARKRGKVFNWETAKFCKIWYDEDVHDLRSVETEFLAIDFNDQISSKKILSCETTVSSLNNEIDFRVSFDDFDDEDYTVIFDKNSFSYKIIFVNDLKKDSENGNEKVNMPSFPPPEPTVSCFDDLDFFKDFENEFPAIVYNNAQTSKSDLLTEPILNPQHIDEFNWKDETSLSECDEEEQNVLNFNDLFPFNVIYPNDSKSGKDNDDDKVNIEHSSEDLSVKPLPDVINIDGC
ncbi:putative reverse transcriptase domain-containing protein [Tanacetum coccineum]